jgi:hypothetical protein
MVSDSEANMFPRYHPQPNKAYNDKAHPRYSSLPFLPSMYLHEDRCTEGHTTGKCRPTAPQEQASCTRFRSERPWHAHVMVDSHAAVLLKPGSNVQMPCLQMTAHSRSITGTLSSDVSVTWSR